MMLRQATLNDWAVLFYWHSDPTTRASSTTSATSLEAHMQWLRRAIASGTLFVAVDDHDKIGTVRLDVFAGAAEIHLTVAPDQRGKRYSTAIIAKAVVKCMDLDVTKMVARVRTENYASLRAFADNGFLPESYSGQRIVTLSRSLS